MKKNKNTFIVLLIMICQLSVVQQNEQINPIIKLKTQQKPNQKSKYSLIPNNQYESNLGSLQSMHTQSVDVVRRIYGVSLLIAVILLIISIGFLYFNEKRLIKHKFILSKTLGLCKEIEGHPQDLEGGLKDNDLVYITGETKAYKVLKDDLINKEFKETVKLRRKVETLQFQEIKHEEPQIQGESVIPAESYSYQSIWTDKIIDSSKFNNQMFNANIKFIVKSYTEYNDQVYINQLKVGKEFINQMQRSEGLQLSEDLLQVQLKLLSQRYNMNLFIKDNRIHLQKELDNETIGDQRISYEYYQTGETTIVGQYFQSGLRTYTIDKKIVEAEEKDYLVQEIIDEEKEFLKKAEKMPLIGDGIKKIDEAFDLEENSTVQKLNIFTKELSKMPTKIFWLTEYFISKQDIFNKKIDINDTVSMKCRILGAIVMYVAYCLFIPSFLDVFLKMPLIGFLLNFILAFAAPVLAIIFTALTISMIMALSWSYLKPEYAIPVIGVIGTIIIIIVVLTIHIITSIPI